MELEIYVCDGLLQPLHHEAHVNPKWLRAQASCPYDLALLTCKDDSEVIKTLMSLYFHGLFVKRA